jgi:hypothetical protein
MVDHGIPSSGLSHEACGGQSSLRRRQYLYQGEVHPSDRYSLDDADVTNLMIFGDVADVGEPWKRL